jgi:hypothetical protein
MMTNAWSLLYDELKMTENFKSPYKSSISNQDFWENDGISLTGNPSTISPDTICFGDTHLPGTMADDHINFIGYATSYPYSTHKVNTDDTIGIIKESPAIPWKYNEEKIVRELLDYIRGTYNQHYSAGDDKIQTLDLIEACGDGEAFCRSNILKYASRYDKKGSPRRDIMKILHYAVLLMNFNDKNTKRELYPQ